MDILIKDFDVFSDDEFSYYINLAKEGNEEARNKVIIYNTKLVLNQVFKRFFNAPYDKNDLVSVGIIGLIKAVDTYDVSISKFSTYAIKCIDNEILMFIRNNKKYLSVESFSQPIYDGDGNEKKIEDIIKDERVDLFEFYANKELYSDLKKQIEILSEGNKEIVKLYFGFYGKAYTQQEVARITGKTQASVSRAINYSLDMLKRNLSGENIRDRNMKKTIYDYFSQYTKEEVDEVLKQLTNEEISLINLRYSGALDKANTNKFYGCLVHKMRRLLSKGKITNESIVIDGENLIDKDDMTRDEIVKTIKLFKNKEFKYLLASLSLKESVVVALRSGYVDNIRFSSRVIAEFLGIEEDDVKQIIKEMSLNDKVLSIVNGNKIVG